jgi:hypothetical protein
MKLELNISDPGWWFTATILVFIMITLAGWQPGYSIVIALSGLQAVYFIWRERSFVTLSAQVGMVYFGLALLGVWTHVQVPIYALLLVGTFMVVFYDRCSIEFLLEKMPWNEGK